MKNSNRQNVFLLQIGQKKLSSQQERYLMQKFLFAAYLIAMIQTGVEVQNDEDGFYEDTDDGTVYYYYTDVWYGPGWYNGIWYNNEWDYHHDWHGNHNFPHHNFHGGSHGGQHWHGQGGGHSGGGHGHGGGHR